MKSIRHMRNYLTINRPETLLLFVYLICFVTGIISIVAEVNTLCLLDKLPDLCVFKRLTGYKCPGCGMTHAFLCLGKFQFTEALRYNIFSVFIFFGGLIRLIHLRSFQFTLSNRILFLLSVMVMGYGVIRNMDLIQ